MSRFALLEQQHPTFQILFSKQPSFLLLSECFRRRLLTALDSRPRPESGTVADTPKSCHASTLSEERGWILHLMTIPKELRMRNELLKDLGRSVRVCLVPLWVCLASAHSADQGVRLGTRSDAGLTPLLSRTLDSDGSRSEPSIKSTNSFPMLAVCPDKLSLDRRLGPNPDSTASSGRSSGAVSANHRS